MIKRWQGELLWVIRMFRIEELFPLFGVPKNPDPHIDVKGVSIDSREDLSEKIFFAIKGRNVDGHTFLKDVFSKGAIGAFIQDASYLDIPGGKNIFLVEDVVIAMGKVAAFYLRKIEKGKKKIAITGSAGKTTTRHIVAKLISHKAKVFSPKGNLNTEIGVPLAIFEIPKDARFLVFEFGADRPGDIKYLSDIVRPDIGIITNVGPSHIERFGSVSEIGKTKWALAEAVKEKDVLIYNADDPVLQKMAFSYEGRKMGFGSKKDAILRLVRRKSTPYGESFTVFIDGNLIDYEIKLYGLSNVYNVLSGIALIYYLFSDLDFVQEVLSSILPVPGRLNLIRKEEPPITIIDDTYNSNPLSLKNSLDVLSQFGDGRRIAVLGDMLELGSFSKVYHREAGRDIAIARSVDVLVGIGKDVEFLVNGAKDSGFDKAYLFREKEKLVDFLVENLRPHDTYLFKASRGMKMEEIMNKFMEKLDD